MALSLSEEISDPKFILFLIYGFLVAILVFCFGLHLMCGDRYPFRYPNQIQVANETEEIESDGIIYELITSRRKNEMDALRAGYLFRILDNFSHTLKEEHMLQRGSSKDEIQNATQKDLKKGFETETGSSIDITQSINTAPKDVEEGFESGVNGRIDNENKTELDKETVEEGHTYNTNSTEPEDEIAEEYTHIVIPCSGVDIDGTHITHSGDGAKNNDSKEKREVPLFCAICLSEYEMGDEVCWSSNSSCTHVFHKECVVEWLVALGRRKSRMQRFPRIPDKKKLLGYEMECPCCRQEFILADGGKEEV